MRLFRMVVCIALACAAWPATAPALKAHGDDGRDAMSGTARTDVLRGLGGNDRLRGHGGRDRLFGGRGRDRLYGDGGGDVLRGGPDDDRLVGGGAADLLRGGTGDDTIRARDGRRDRVSCGPGRDSATLDALDVITDALGGPQGRCEVVHRPAKPDAFMVAAGDIARCPGGAGITAALIDGLPGTVAAVGDTVYESGTPAEYASCYEPTWGRHKARTRPIPGNHEYRTPGASGYFGYFGAAAGDPGKGYYSYALGEWHVVALNSNCADVGGCQGAGSAQERWLRADLAANPTRCAVAYVHHPAFSSGDTHGGSPSVRPLLRALQDQGVELLLSGDDHDYERFAPQTVEGVASAAGVRQFVVGTGGATLRGFGQPEPNSEARIAGVYGVLSLKLRATAYDWRFVPQPGSSASDTGTAACH